jgi:hypothetical protein
MSLIDIESTKKVVETISQIPTATLTPKILPTQEQSPFEFPLRSTSSFPYILEKVGEKMEKENSHQAYDEIMYQINAVQFNAGCSSSSTDLDKLIEFYNNHSDEDTMAQWMNIYEEQKLANSIATNSRAGNNNNHYGGETNLGRFKNRDISDSVDDLLHQSPTKRIPKAIDALNKEAPFNRSMDLPITGADKDGFFALEKCQSVDFHTTKFDLPSARLLRSKELANIADIDDDTEY